MIKKTIFSMGLLMLLAGCAFNGGKDSKALTDQGVVDDASVAQVCGTVAYRERIALPPDAEIHLTLADVSLQDALSRLIADDTITAMGRQVPIPFCLKYSPADIDPRHTYQVRAEIFVNGKLRFTTDTAYPVITRGAPGTVDIRVVSAWAVGGERTMSEVENIRWEMIELNGEAVTASAGRDLPWFQLASEGKRVNGFNGCNRFFGVYKRAGDALTFTQPMGSTMMACPPDVTIDRAFMKALEAVATCRIVDGVLEIYNGEGDLLARLKSNL